MRLVIDKESFKNFYKIMLTSTKLGEDIFFECRLDGLTIKAVNDARSLFFFSKFERRFFEEYQITELIECKFKAKSIIVAFKSSAIFEKNLKSLEFFVDKEKDDATFQLNFDMEDVSIHEVNFIANNLQVNLDVSQVFDNYLMAKNKSLVSLFSIFPNANDYCVMTATENKIEFETYNFKLNEVRTKFVVKPEIFLEYKINARIRTTFILKPMKTFLNSVDRNATCYFYFEDDFCPIHVIVRNNLIEHKFIIASIDVDIDSINEQATTSVQLPRELTSFDLNQEESETNNEDEEMKTNNEEDDDKLSSSSFSSDQSQLLNGEKNESNKIKNERFKSIYSSSSSGKEGTNSSNDDIKNSNTQSSQIQPSQQNNDGLSQQNNNNQLSQEQQQSSQANKSQVDDNQLFDTSFVDDLDIDFESNNQIEEELNNKTANNFTPNHNPTDKNSLDIIASSSTLTSSNHVNNNNNQQDKENIEQTINLNLNSAINSNPTMIDQTTISQTNLIEKPNSHCSNTHSTQEKDESVKMNSFSISRIEANQTSELNTSEPNYVNCNLNDIDFDEDIENCNDSSTERRVENQKLAYVTFTERMPIIFESSNQKMEERNDEQSFTEFINKNRSLLP